MKAIGLARTAIETRAGRLAVKDSRAGDEVVVFVHGWGVDSCMNWAGAVPVTAEGHRVVLVDLPGHGASSCGGRFDIETCARGIVDALDYLQIERFTLCGYSLGGAVVQVLAGVEPRRTAGVVYVASAMRFDRAPRWVTASGCALLRASSYFPDVPGLRRRLPVVLGDGSTRATDDSERDGSGGLGVVLRHDRAALADSLEDAVKYDGLRHVERYTGPGVVVCTRHDRVVPARRQLELARYSKAEVIETPFGHDLCFKPCFGGLIAEALGAVSQRRVS